MKMKFVKLNQICEQESMWKQISVLYKRVNAAIERGGISEAEILAKHRSKLLGQYYAIGGQNQTIDLYFAYKFKLWN